MAFNIFSTLNQNLQNFGGDAYDAYQAGKSKVGNVASTINTNLQDFGGDLYDAGNQIKNNVSNFGTQTYNQGKNVASTIKKNVGDYATQQINEIKAIPSQIGEGIDTVKKGVRDANYNMWNSGLKSFTGKNNSTLTEAFPNAYNELSKNTGKADEDKVMKFVEEIAKAGYDQDQAMEILQTTLAEQPDYFNKKTPFDRVRQTAANRGREFGKTYEDFSSGKIGFGEATLRNAGDIIATPFGVMGDGAMSIPGVETAVGKVGETITSIPGVKPGMEAYGEFAKNNPRFAENAEAITNLGLSALGSTQGQALMKKGANVLGRKVAQGADYIDDVTSPITTPISNTVSKGGEKIKSILAPINPDEQILKDAGLKTVKGMVGDKVVEIPEYGIMDKARSFVAPAETKRLVNRALSPRGTGLGDKQKLASVVNAEKNVRNYHQLVRSGKLKGDLSSLESTAQSVVDNLDEVGSKIGKAVDKVQANVSISDDAYKAIDDAIGARGASRTPTAKILENFKEDTAGSMTLKEAFDIKKIYQTEIGKLIRSSDAGTPQYSALVKGVEELTNQIDNAIETQLKGSKFKELKSQYRLMKSMVGDITNSAMVEGRRSPQTFVEQLGTIEAMGNILSSPLATGRQFLAKEIGEMNTRGGSWKELVKRLDDEAVSAYKKSQTTAGKAMKREMENLPVATTPPIVPKAKPKATKESALKTTPVVPEKKSIVAKKEATVKTPTPAVDNIRSTKGANDFVDYFQKDLGDKVTKEGLLKFGFTEKQILDNTFDFLKTKDNELGVSLEDLFRIATQSEASAMPIKTTPKVATKPPIVSKAKPKAATESAFKNNKGFINPSEIKKSLIPKKGADEAKQFYDDLVYAGNSPIVAQRETAKRFGTIKAMSASKAGTLDISASSQNKKRQLAFIHKNNPMQDDIHTGIRKVEDIKTFKETLSDPESLVYPDFTIGMAERALKENKITIYSSKPLDTNLAQFVTPSKMQASDYAGNGKVYSKKVELSEVAWINSDEGQLVGKMESGTSKALIQKKQSATIDDMETKKLIEEAKKYKSADEFIKSKATLLHGSPKGIVEDFSKGKGLSTTGDINNPTYHFTNDIEKAKLFSRQWELDSWNKVKNTPGIKPRTNLPNPGITKAYLDIKNPYVREKGGDLSSDFIKKLKSEGYDGIINDYGNGKEYIVFSTSQIKTESQLKQIYEQANKK